MASAVRLGIIDAMADGPKTAKFVADSLKLNHDAVSRLLRALSATNVVNRIEEHYFQLREVGITLTKHHPMSSLSFLLAATDRGFWSIFGAMEETIKTGAPSTHKALGMDIWEYHTKFPEEGQMFADAVHQICPSILYALLSAYRFEGKRIVDGGTDSIGVLFDLDNIKAITLPHPRVIMETGDFFERVPSGDIYLLKHILHDWDDTSCICILSNIAKSMESHGKVCVVEVVIGENSGMLPVVVDVNMMVIANGRERTAEEYKVI
ncbi:hypothetical protein HK098_000545 [Nowakowskiella sp. JEL0407]|nr:hypothetical protein HK098_000545 [Nowakowskiella sp. JEL0407]